MLRDVGGLIPGRAGSGPLVAETGCSGGVKEGLEYTISQVTSNEKLKQIGTVPDGFHRL